MQGNNLDTLTKQLTKELENVSDYFKANQLKLNAKKTKMVIFRKKSLPPNHTEMNVYLDGVKLCQDDHAEFLGTTIDCTLSWDKHCTNVANKLSRNNGVLNRVKKQLPASSLKLLYYTLLQPHIQYTLPVWGGCKSSNTKRIINIQKRAIRIITKSYHTAHTEPRMKKLGLLSFDDLYTLQNSMLIHDCFYGHAPLHINNCIQIKPSSDHFLRNQTDNPFELKIPNTNSRAGNQSFSTKGPSQWNDIPKEIRAIKEKGRFKKIMKMKLLEKYETKSTCTNPRCNDNSNHLCA